MAQTMSSFDAMLLKDIRGPVREIVQLSNATIAQLNRKPAKATQGTRFEFPLHTAYTEAVGARAENIDLPDPQDEEYERPYDTVKSTYGKIELTLDVMLASRNRRGAFAQALGENTGRMIKRVGAEMNRIVHGTGDGKLAVVGTSVTAGDTDIVCEEDPGVSWVRPKMNIDVWEDDSLTAEKFKVTAVDPDTWTITVSQALPAITAATTAHVTRHAARNTAGTTREQHGLQEIVEADEELHALDPEDAPEWSSYVKTSVGVPTEVVLRQVLDNIEINSGVGPASPGQTAITTHSVRAAFFQELSPNVRIDPVQLKGGFTSLNIHGLSLMLADTDCQTDACYVVYLPELEIRDFGDWNWLNQDGHYLHRTARATFEATLYRFWQLITYIRGAHGKLEDITGAYS